ncbi:MAG: asparagine--tRNA ligase, partial [Flavobacteriaceae bacterium]
MLVKLKALFASTPSGQEVTVRGWVRTFRANRFIALNDGSTIENIQCVVDFDTFDDTVLKQISSGAALKITGLYVESQGKGQKAEIQVEQLQVYGTADPDTYPIQPKKHSFEFLREKAHLRIRTATFSAVMRVRAALAFGVHEFFKNQGFHYIHTPIITGSDAEGAGEMFRVSALDPKNPPLNDKGEVNYTQDFFGKETHLTVSGQLEAETYAMGLGEVYTFGPTFRAENSNTTRHLAEFWMIEPEMAFYDLDDNMDLAEKFIKAVLSYILDNCGQDLAFLDERFKKEESTKPQVQRSEMGLIEKIKFVVDNEFKRLSYTEAIDILKNSKPNKKKKFKFPIDEWGADLQSEHERYLVEKHFKTPVIS